VPSSPIGNHPSLCSKQEDFRYYERCIEAIVDNSPDARVFVLIHKMDLIPDIDRDQVFKERSDLIRSRSFGMDVVTFRTSIWDETLYKVYDTRSYSTPHPHPSLPSFLSLGLTTTRDLMWYY
jgi:hypothetical protein